MTRFTYAAPQNVRRLYANRYSIVIPPLAGGGPIFFELKCEFEHTLARYEVSATCCSCVYFR